jgi:hypothetical protein
MVLGPLVRERPTLGSILDDFELRGVEIEERLNAYFPQEIARDWRAYRLFVTATFSVWRYQERVTTYQLTHKRRRHFVTIQAYTVEDWDQLSHSLKFLSGLDYQGVRAIVRGRGSEWSTYDRNELLNDRNEAYPAVETAALHVEHAIAREVLESHPRGYSTNFSDFLDDLLP